MSVVVLLAWWYFTDAERWDPATHGMSYLGSTSVDSTKSTTPSGADSVRNSTFGSAAVSNAVKTDLSKEPAEHPIRVEIWNGCGEKGLALKAMTALRARSSYFDVRGMGNAGAQRFEFSAVISRTTNAGLAMAIADSLGIDHARVTTDIPKNPRDIDVTVILGADYPRLRLNLKPDSKE
ncbi:MAG TPA: LytR C-terminal domain-containing protein [bacterium]